MLPELKRLIEQIGKEKGIDKDVIIDALETAVLSAAKKKLGPNFDLEARYNEEVGEVEVFQFKTVVDNVIHPDTQISFEEARETMDEDAELGDSLGMKVETATFGRIAAQAAKQIIIQKVKDAERDNVYEEYKDKKGELGNGFVQRFEGGSIVVNLGRAEGIIPASEQIPREKFKRGERIRAYICEVKDKMAKGPQIILSRTHPGFLRSLFELEVPEISEGLIEIMNVSREPGNRSKISVKSKDRDVDPVGACVGMRGSRVQSVVQELRGERIDIVPYSDDPVKYVCNALSPAKVDRAYVYDEVRSMEIIVPDDQLSLAIGRNGQNVRLAARLTGWKLDVKSKSTSKQGEPKAELLTEIAGIDEHIADVLFKNGIRTVAAIAAADSGALSAITEKGEEEVLVWIEEAGRILERKAEEENG